MPGGIAALKTRLDGGKDANPGCHKTELYLNQKETDILLTH